jgi:hypothetical protein
MSNSITFRYRSADTVLGVTRETVQRLQEVLGVDETQVIHLALTRLAATNLPQYGPDDGPLTAAQMRMIDRLVPQRERRNVIDSLFPGRG